MGTFADFMMFRYKVEPCTKEDEHDHDSCPFAHPGDRFARRDPLKVPYSSTVCVRMRHRGACVHGDACPYAHSANECWLHPSRYRTRMCQQRESCTRPVCFFAHSTEELRVLGKSSPFHPDVLGKAGSGKASRSAEGAADSPRHGRDDTNAASSPYKSRLALTDFALPSLPNLAAAMASGSCSDASTTSPNFAYRQYSAALAEFDTPSPRTPMTHSDGLMPGTPVQSVVRAASTPALAFMSGSTQQASRSGSSPLPPVKANVGSLDGALSSSMAGFGSKLAPHQHRASYLYEAGNFTDGRQSGARHFGAASGDVASGDVAWQTVPVTQGVTNASLPQLHRLAQQTSISLERAFSALADATSGGFEPRPVQQPYDPVLDMTVTEQLSLLQALQEGVQPLLPLGMPPRSSAVAAPSLMMHAALQPCVYTAPDTNAERRTQAQSQAAQLALLLHPKSEVQDKGMWQPMTEVSAEQLSWPLSTLLQDQVTAPMSMSPMTWAAVGSKAEPPSRYSTLEQQLAPLLPVLQLAQLQ